MADLEKYQNENMEVQLFERVLSIIKSKIISEVVII